MKRTSSRRSTLRDRIDAIREDSNLRGYARWREIGDLVLADLKRGGKFFNTQQGLFYFEAESRRAFPLSEQDMEFAALVNRQYGINPKEHCFKLVLANLQSEAIMHGEKIEARRLAHYDRQSNQLYVSRFDGNVYCLDGTKVAPVENGRDKVFFFDDLTLWEPYRYIPDAPKGDLDRQIIESVNFVDSHLSVREQQLLLKIWLLAVFFGNVQPTKIILLLLGEHGSGKTSALRRIQKMIFGQKVNLLSIEKDKQDGFIATITTDPIALFDNLDEHISWLPPALSRLATGVTFSRRRLYTTNEKVEFPGVSWLGITSRTLTFMDRQPDLPDRTLVLKLERFPERRPEEDLLSAVALRRNALWSELLDELNAVVRYMSEHPEPVPVTFRMADFAAFALKVATVWRCREEVCTALAKMEEAQKWLLSEKDPVHQILERWLKIRDNRIRLVGAGELYCEWNSLADQEGVPWPYSSAKSLGLALTHLRPGLESRFGLEVTYDSHLKQNRYRFGRQPESPQNSPSETDESRDALEELAGFAGSSKP